MVIEVAQRFSELQLQIRHDVCWDIIDEVGRSLKPSHQGI
jgi:hypothetical protein